MMWVSIGLGTAFALILITIVSVLTGGSVHTKKSQNPLTSSALVGTTIASFSLKNLGGMPQTMPWRQHHPGVVIFFASWCPPCQGEMPKVAAYLRTHDLGSVRVIGVDANDKLMSGTNFVHRDGVSFPVVFDAHGAVTSGIFGFQNIPETVFVNAKGVVTGVYYGAIPTKLLADGIRALRAA
jgi:thiol-disulfide isomerase/thioredoxin